ncbi:hypothetical protein BZA05DRAFT_253801 [Tricharina praecox]|uniref:uncharacterized protein n=1 Tax=Tricharina praecox TaxID=43433 RepID=UPI00221F4870|nr:uncharacterized protein BZA05DRAFT_253801 [Tricharina praecox]KAI5854932.1 hypothetical protein BZA05DRAFT_253801 [Tricharina praecox]
MTAPSQTTVTVLPHQRPGGFHNNNNNHRHTKSSSSVAQSQNIVTPRQKSQPNIHTAQQIQSPPRSSEIRNSNNNTLKTPRGDGGSTKKKRRQRKPKDIVNKSSPEQSNARMSTQSHRSPTMNTVQTTPTKAPLSTPPKAYAGPTFHHSPAPSTLPLPKFFFSKSVPSARTQGLQAMMEEDDNSSTTTGSQPSSPPVEGPLEQLFRADREEKARKNRSFSDNSDSDSTPEIFGRDIFSMDPESPVRTVFNTPRSSVVRPTAGERAVTEPMFTMDSLNANLPASPASTGRNLDEAERIAKTAALRQLLFQQPGISPVASPVQHRAVPDTHSTPVSAARNNGNFYVSPFGSPVAQRQQSRQFESMKMPPAQQKMNQYRTAPAYSQPLPQYNDIQTPYYNTTTNSQQFSNVFDSRYDSMPCKVESRDYLDIENHLRQVLKLAPRNPVGGVMI